MSSEDLTPLLQAAKKWLKWDPNEQTRSEIDRILKENDTQNLKLCFQSRIDFGTAGLRGAMKAGNAFMNDLTVIQASQGLCVYLESEVPELKQKGICIGYDARHNSKRYAERSAATFLFRKIPVYLFSETVPTPFLAYSIRRLGSSAGVMVTASHNPKEDNGYKVYWGNGAQIISPVDKGIAKCILENLKPWKIPTEILENNQLLRDPTEDILRDYFKEIQKWCFYGEENKNSKLKITYTAMHGVGAKAAARAFQSFHLPEFFPVVKQHQPDPDFPTVPFPNPEEGKGALKLSMETAEKHGSQVIIANDPDADRMAAAEKKVDGTWYIFNGDEIGIMLGHWVFSNYGKKHPEMETGKLVVLNTTVSCKMLEAFAKHEGLYYNETLTGFKWLGNLALDLEKQNYTFLFAYEEAIGYMIGTTCLDKDGISAAAIFGEMASTLYAKNRTCLDYLWELYDKYGHFVIKNRYFFCYDPQTMFRIFDEIRNNGKYSERCGDFPIKSIRDLKTPGYDSSQPQNKPILPTGSSENLTIFFENGAIVTLRGSGTEPKLKYYCQMSGKDRITTEATLQALVSDVIKNFLKPDKYNLQPPKD